MNENNSQRPVISVFQTYLHEHGLRDTYERRCIVKTIAQYKGNFDIDTIATDLQQAGQRMSRATIYNTLSLLTQAGIVRRQQFTDGRYHYDCVNRLPAGNLLHLICNKCGKISELRNPAIIRNIADMKFGAFTPQYISMTVYGTCSRCLKRQKMLK